MNLEDNVHVYLMFKDSNAMYAVLVFIVCLLQAVVVCYALQLFSYNNNMVYHLSL